MSAPAPAAVPAILDGAGGTSARVPEAAEAAPQPARDPAPEIAGIAHAGIAYVVFCGDTHLGWLRVLRPGFRHCFLAVNDGAHWITLDPLSTYTELAVQPVPAGFDLAGWYRAAGRIVVPARIDRARRRPAPWAPFTCVEAVKRALGIHDRWLLTPFQLYRHLLRARIAAPAAPG